MKALLTLLVVAAAAGAALFLSGALYVVDETQQVVVTRFGAPVKDPVTTAGLKFKTPFIDKAHVFEKRILQWDGDPNRIPTRDKKYIYIDTFGRWRITDPLPFYRSVRDERSAQGRLDDIIDGATRNVIAAMNLIEVVRTSTRTFVASEFGVEITDEDILKDIAFGREKIDAMILAQAAPKLVEYGIRLEDVQIKRINYVENVRQTVYDRMISERRRAAEQFRSEGQGEKAKIEGQMQRDLQTIQSEAQRRAQEVRGKADREALQILSRAYGRDPAFFAFYETLQSYPETLRSGGAIYLSTDNEYIRYLKSLAP